MMELCSFTKLSSVSFFGFDCLNIDIRERFDGDYEGVFW